MQTDLLARLISVERAVEPALLDQSASGARAVTALAPVRPVTPTLPHLAFGQIVRAQVAARFPDGSFRVEIDGTALKLSLPSGTRPGDVWPLRFVGRAPQLQFELHLPSTEANTRVSSAGRLIGQLLSEPAELALPQAQPVVGAPTTESAQLREALARAIERSGLFYEAHQARWLRGEYPLERLRHEPQTVLASNRQNPEPMPDDLRNAAHTSARASARGPQAGAFLEPQDLNRLGIATAESSAVEDEAGNLVARESLPVVRQQLDALATRQFSWQGEIWPGQRMDWQIAEQDSDAEQPESDRDWRTQLSLSLPALGDISAELELDAQGVHVSLTADDSIAAAAMHAAAPELLRALEAAGVKTIGLKVRQSESSR